MNLQIPPPSLPIPLSLSLPPLPFFQPPPPPPPPSPPFNLENKISPSILLIIIVILAVIFFISGLLHLLVRFILRPINREPEDLDNATVLQGQLQQLFHLHDAGVDQSHIDTLPIFLYKAIIGLKDPFDCAVCLCEFEADDKLRLLPKCSHAFHLDCIDTWLLSHSTCPLCRRSLLPDYFSPCCSPMVLVLESGNVSSREICSELGDHEDDDDHLVLEDVLEEKVVPVKLGKFRSNNGGEGTSSVASKINIDHQRRCFSMGSFEYVMDDTSLLQVAIKPSSEKKKKRDEGFKGFHSSRSFQSSDANINANDLQKESFSFSKIWLKEKKESSVFADNYGSRMVLSRAEEAPSFARRTLNWLVGRQQNKVVSHV
ncbi:hypothetical protein J5N97_026852 [Dioscorea zingiberensis]|uniref:RING-type E3 ubiquitin transferase n=1 Tax=Dioscorea zingiberensis TaxID=325984 RepID=A0A9D5C415_9LILI|nr:hypothetical protein J5N97_026852 [Dioscorea zingiberensis]